MATRNYRIAAIFAVIMLLWLLSGLLVDRQPTDLEGTKEKSAALTLVSARHISAQSFPTEVIVRARTEVNRDVEVRAEISGQVTAVPVKEGTLVKAGDVICELAVEDRRQRLDEAAAEVATSQLEYDGALRLKSAGYQSKTAIASAKAKLKTAKANFKRSQLNLAQLKIQAPFDGVVDSRPVEIGDLMQRGDVCATVLDLDPLVISGRVSESEVGRIPQAGDAVALLATGEQVRGNVRFVSRSSDEVTRTFRIEVAVPNPDLTMHGGITTQLRIPTGEVPAHLISASVLALDDAGNVAVRIIDKQDRVKLLPVTLIGDHPKGVWVTGLPAEALLITVGQEYVLKGEKVAVSLENGATANKSAQQQIADTKAAHEKTKKSHASEAKAVETPVSAEQLETTPAEEPESEELPLGEQPDMSAAQL